MEFFELRSGLDHIEDREMGNEAVISISSAKPGNGVEQLRDDSLDTYWQSDGSSPHTINIQFLRKALLTKLCIYVDHSMDESYTPRKIVLSSGSCVHDLADIAVIPELNEPVGWLIIDLEKCMHADGVGSKRSFLPTYFVQIRVTGMHQNGKYTHVRQI
jgi:anaphase-promoting complex subunit 10